MNRKGRPVSGGYAIAPILIYKPVELHIGHTHFSDASCEREQVERYRAACLTAGSQLQKIYDAMCEDRPDQAKVFQAHMEILEDDTIHEEIEALISAEQCTPEYAVEQIYEQYIASFQRNRNLLIRERASDLKDVKQRLLRTLLGAAACDISHLDGPVILAAYDLLPADTATMDHNNVRGIVTEIGGETSHTAILAKSFGIPAVLGVKDLLKSVSDGELAVLDGCAGELITSPEDVLLKEYQAHEEAFQQRMTRISQFQNGPAFTKDGTRIEIGANMGSAAVDELQAAAYTDFCGLFRTEFLYMGNDHMPTEEEQFVVYRSVVEAYQGRPVIIRTLDIGGDKSLPYYQMPKEDNPFLGNRALRFCFSELGLFSTQIRALLRASVYGTLWIMLPMVSSIDDVRKAKKIIWKVREELERDGIPYDKHVKCGIMIEVPAVAVIADLVAQEVDFASIGTNDLCQYVTAADRLNPLVSDYYQSHHPALLRLINHVVKAFSGAGKPICLCGELGADPVILPMLIGFGMRKVSMSPGAVAQAKQLISTITISETEQIARKTLGVKTSAEADQLGREYLKNRL